MTDIRYEKPEDKEGVWQVNEQAFGRREESDLVDALRLRDEPVISLVAIEEGKVVGHILFSEATIHARDSTFGIVALGPLAVLPSHQNKGIGSSLVRKGLDECRKAGYEAVVVLGHPRYYPRFGFVPSKRYGFRCEWEVPDDVFMVLELCEGALASREGTVKYLPEFSKV